MAKKAAAKPAAETEYLISPGLSEIDIMNSLSLRRACSCAAAPAPAGAKKAAAKPATAPAEAKKAAAKPAAPPAEAKKAAAKPAAAPAKKAGAPAPSTTGRHLLATPRKTPHNMLAAPAMLLSKATCSVSGCCLSDMHGLLPEQVFHIRRSIDRGLHEAGHACTPGI